MADTLSKSQQIKEKSVNELVDKIKNSKTFMIVSIKSVPSKQFQEIKKSIRKHAQVQVAKKNILIRALEKYGKESIKPIENYVKENCAFATSDMEGYELAGILSKEKTPVFAKAGQVSPTEIEVKEGPTDLVPGPAISELGALGIQIAVEDGKISIKQDRVIVKEGQKINEETASLLQKLNIQPFHVRLDPIAIYDIENEKVFTDIKIDSEKASEDLTDAAGKALGFAQKIAYYCKETIGYLLAKANMHGEALSKLQPSEKKPAEEKKEEAHKEGEENKESSEEKSEEAPKEDNKEENAEEKKDG